MVLPASYNVALVVDGKTLDTKPLHIIMDPAVQLTDAQRKRYNEVAADLHELQRRGTETAGALNTLYPQMTEAASKLKDATNVPADVKAQFDALQKQFDAVRVKFGVPIQQAGGRGFGGGGGRGGAIDPENVLARTSALKTQILAIWEVPSDALLRQYNELKSALPRAVSDASAFLGQATTVSQALKRYDITLMVPASK